MIDQYLTKIGMNEKEKAIYLTLVEVGVQPASIVARKCKLDRVTTYKNLKKMADKGFVKMYYRDSVQCFGIESFDTLQTYLKERINNFESLIEEFPMAENFLKTLKAEESLIPKLQIFEGESGIKSFFRDLLFEAKEQKLRRICMLTSNTFEERLGEVPLSKFVDEFFSEVQRRKLDLDILEASGTLVPERIRKVSFQDFRPEKFPAARGTTNVFLVGHAVYIACYGSSQIGLKIKQSEISQIFHFLFDFIRLKAS